MSRQPQLLREIIRSAVLGSVLAFAPIVAGPSYAFPGIDGPTADAAQADAIAAPHGGERLPVRVAESPAVGNALLADSRQSQSSIALTGGVVYCAPRSIFGDGLLAVAPVFRSKRIGGPNSPRAPPRHPAAA